MATSDAPFLFLQLRGCSPGSPELALKRRTAFRKPYFTNQVRGTGVEADPTRSTTRHFSNRRGNRRRDMLR